MELEIIHAFQRIQNAFWDSFFYSFSILAHWGAFAFVFALLYFSFKKEQLHTFFIVTYGAAVGANFFLKLIFGRVRPWIAHQSVWAIFETYRDYAFPSGHTVSITVAACFASYFVFKKINKLSWRIALHVGIWAIALLGGLSRIYLGMHYPTDILGGIMVGILFSQAGIFAHKWFLNYTEKKSIASLQIQTNDIYRFSC